MSAVGSAALTLGAPVALAAALMATSLAAQSAELERSLCFGDGPPAECSWWTVTDFNWGQRVWGGGPDRLRRDATTFLLWEYGVARNLSERHAIGVSGLLTGGRLLSEKGVGAAVRYRYRIHPRFALDVAGGATRQGDRGVVRLNMAVGVRFSDRAGLAYLGRSDRWGGSGYAAARLHGIWGLAVGSVLGLLYFTFPET